jgi:hypothetical protein
MKPIVQADLEQLDEQLRLGNIKGVRRYIRTLSPARIPRQQLLKLANLSRRSGLIDFGMRLLNPVVRSDSPEREKATPEENIEYAVLLARIGATSEARSILEEINARAHPESILYRTFTLTPEWRYQETIPLLEQYIASASNNPYMQLVAKVNLAAALVFVGRNEDAGSVIAESLIYAEEKNHKLLYANLLELAAQSALGLRNFRAAESHLEASLKILGGSETSESLYVEKWQAVLRVLRRPGKKQRENLQVVRDKAVLQNEWEIVRDCDYHLASNFYDSDLLLHLFFGTPYQSYREKLERISPGLSQLKSYTWSLVNRGANRGVQPSFEMDLTTGKDVTGHQVLSLHQMPHRLLVSLAKDFYRPQRFASLGAELFPGEYFDPINTPLRIHKTCTRLRQLFQKQNLPLDIEVRSNSIRLFGSAKLRVENAEVLSSNPTDRKRLDFFKSLQARFETKKFSSAEAAKLWKCSVSTASRRINEAIESGLCEQIGSGRGSAFQIKPK